MGLLLLDIAKPDKHLSRSTAELYGYFLEILFGALLLLWNVGKRILVLQLFYEYVIDVFQVRIARRESNPSSVTRDEVKKLVLSVDVGKKILANVLELDAVVLCHLSEMLRLRKGVDDGIDGHLTFRCKLHDASQ